MYLKKYSSISMNSGSRRTIIPHDVADILEIDDKCSLEWIVDLNDQSEYEIHINVRRDENENK